MINWRSVQGAFGRDAPTNAGLELLLSGRTWMVERPSEMRVDREREKRLALMREIRNGTMVTVVRRSWARLYAVNCLDGEASRLRAITDEEMDRLGSILSSYLGVRRRIPSVRVLCLGLRVDRADLPAQLRHELSASCRGAWLGSQRVAVVWCDRKGRERQVIIHELAHALLDLLTDGFLFPLVIQEGYARAIECMIPGSAKSNSGHTQRAHPGGFVAPSDALGIEDLLRAQWTAGSAGKLTNLAFWLNVYLSKFPPRGQIVKRMLRELWDQDIRSPSGVYAWILAACEMSRAVAENGFREFCTTGRHFASN